MVRLTVASIVLIAMVGCTGLIGDGSEGGTPQEIAARNAWLNKALPRLQESCIQCHDGSRANIGFIQADNDLARRDTLLAYTPAVVNLDAPPSSRILTKGVHEGPELGAEAASDLLDWIQKEKEAQAHSGSGSGDPIIATAQVIPQYCTGGASGSPTCPFNNIGLDDIGAPGAKISFTIQALGSGLYVTNLKVVPGTGGVYIEHPLWVGFPANGGDPVPDTIDRFFAVKMDLMATATATDQTIAGGTAAFVGFPAGPMDKIQIHFKKVGPFDPAAAGGGAVNNSCRDLASFKANAQGPLNTNCASCHTGTANPSAKSALNMSGVETAVDTTIQAACDQIRGRVDLNAAANSGLFQSPKPGNMNHPFTFGGNQTLYDNFVAAVTAWINIEKTKP
jgi:hypothetical protein